MGLTSYSSVLARTHVAGNSLPGLRPRNQTSRRGLKLAKSNRASGLRARVRPEGVGDSCYRWYELQTGRYTSVDPLGPYGSRHPFAYARNRPLRYVDRLGLKECGAAPVGPEGTNCLEFCNAQKAYAECQLHKQLEGIHIAGAGLAAITGTAAGFETGNLLVGCLVGGGVLLIDLGIHYAWESFGGGGIGLAYKKCRQTCCAGDEAGEGGGGGGICPGT